MGFTDSPVMAGPYAHLSTPDLRRLALQAEQAQVAGPVPADASTHLVGFSTALTDAECSYLNLCAELFARGEYVAGRQSCEGEQLAVEP
jgi:hypothetical protein